MHSRLVTVLSREPALLPPGCRGEYTRVWNPSQPVHGIRRLRGMGVVRGPAPYYYSGVRSNIPGNLGARRHPTPVGVWWGGGCVVFSSTHAHLTVVSLVCFSFDLRVDTKLKVLRR